MKIKAIVFDMDGVLIEAKDWHYEALNRALSLFGFEITRDEHLSTYDGLPTKVKLQKLSETGPLPDALHGFINQMKQKYTLDVARELLRPCDNQLATLEKLKSEGYVIGVASNSIRATVAMMMEQAGIQPYLDFMLSNEDVEKAKPHPEIYNASMKLAGVQPHECLVLEDNAFGWQAATGAGAHLLKIDCVSDVNYANIRNAIDRIEGAAELVPPPNRMAA